MDVQEAGVNNVIHLLTVEEFLGVTRIAPAVGWWAEGGHVGLQ